LLFSVITTLNEEIKFETKSLDVRIGNCDPFQYEVYDHNKILTCENAICHHSCPLDFNAKCVIKDGNFKGKNIIKNNLCECHEGWIGEYCDTKDFVDFR